MAGEMSDYPEWLDLAKQDAEELSRNAETMDRLHRSDYEYTVAWRRAWDQKRRMDDAKWRIYAFIVITVCSILGAVIGQWMVRLFR
jgi:hypothetical protein